MSENQTPTYDQTVAAQGWDPIRGGIVPAAVEIDGTTITVQLTPAQARLARQKSVGGYSIRKGGRR
jgi:hypothetical protein